MLADFLASLAFLTRLPTSDTRDDAPPDFTRASRMFPVVGVIVGLIGAAILVATALLGTPPALAAALAVAATLAVTGALHEDGLADTLDGFGGGKTRDRKLEIMRDSNIGTFGAVALIFSILFRVLALWSLARGDPWRAGLVLIAAEAVSRAAMLQAWSILPAARADGLAHDTGPPSESALLTGQAVSLAVVLALVWPVAGFAAMIAGILLTVIVTYIFIRMARAQIGGRTGDTLGACQQIAVAAFLIGAASAS